MYRIQDINRTQDIYRIHDIYRIQKTIGIGYRQTKDTG